MSDLRTFERTLRRGAAPALTHNEAVPTPPQPQAPPAQRIRTFHARNGRTTPRSTASLDRLWPRYGLDVSDGIIDLAHTFGPNTPVVLELGFGKGEGTAATAKHHRETAILAVDVHAPGVLALLRLCEHDSLDNVRVIHGDGIAVLSDALGTESLAGIRAYFPDPWPKTRHHKRRLIRPDLVTLAARRIRPGGFFHTATDWPDYAEQMLAVLNAEPLLSNDHDGFAPRPANRPLTRYEKRGIAAGRQIYDLQFHRTETTPG
ncbi:MAG: tRNA (guanosine(46)-N7)-methyltransferase TrmB [Actinomycetes bacterium]